MYIHIKHPAHLNQNPIKYKNKKISKTDRKPALMFDDYGGRRMKLNP